MLEGPRPKSLGRGPSLGVRNTEYLQIGTMLSAVVVGVRGLPGAGFFECARTLGLLAPGDPDERAFWEIELAAVREEWGR